MSAHRGAWPARKPTGLRYSAWNLVLLAPLIVLITPLFNSARPSLIGLPFFYWFQFVFVFVGVISVAITYVATRDRTKHAEPATPQADADQLDEGAGR